MSRNFQVSLTCDFMPAAGEPDVGLDLLRAEACVEYQLFRSMPPEVAPEQIADFDALLLGGYFEVRVSNLVGKTRDRHDQCRAGDS